MSSYTIGSVGKYRIPIVSGVALNAGGRQHNQSLTGLPLSGELPLYQWSHMSSQAGLNFQWDGQRVTSRLKSESVVAA